MMTADDIAHFLMFLAATAIVLLGSAVAWAVVDWLHSSPEQRHLFEAEATAVEAAPSE